MTDSAGYYSDRFSAERLRRCYEIAPPRVRQYFEAEIRYVLDKVRPSDMVLELGCGYGRVLDKLAAKARVVVGIDNAPSSLELAKSTERVSQLSSTGHGCRFAGLCGGGVRRGCVHPERHIRFQGGPARSHTRECTCDQAWRDRAFLKLRGKVLDARLEWFELQAKHGLIGEIDRAQTRGGVIVCKDGFKATTVGGDEFLALCSSLGIEPRIEEVDGSSLFCEIRASDRHQ